MQVKVRNLDEREYVEKFNDEEIRIPAGGYIEMGRAAAVRFLSQYVPIKKDGMGRDLKPKKLRMEVDPEKWAEHLDQPLRFQAFDGTQFRTEVGLKAYEDKVKREASDGLKKGGKI